MLRPERMSRVSVTGAKRVMDEVVEAVHDLHLLHVSEYAGEWEGFEPGDPMEGVDPAAEKLVTVRSLESILDVGEEQAGPARLVTDEALETELEEIRTEVNELDDRRSEIEDELGTVEERIESLGPFVELGIDLELLSGYDSLAVAIGEGDAGAVEEALAAAEAVYAFEVFAAGDAVAAFVYPADGADPDELAIEDLLVGAAFSSYEVPDAEGSPEEYRAELRHRKQQLESRLETVEDEIEDVRLDVAGFLLAAEETLSIDVAKREAPLSFATTENAFVAEGWIPTERYIDLVEALESAVGDHVEVSELERAAYDSHGHAAVHEPVEDDAELPGGEPAAADGSGGSGRDTNAGADGTDAMDGTDAADATDADGEETEARADGGTVAMGNGDPPVLQDNPSVVKPFELLTQAVGRPNYSELDPTLILFLTFPLMFGFMIGDVGYGVIYTGIGYYMYRNFDSATFRNFGIVAAAAGIMTVIFGVLYGEIFGLHLVTTYLWEPLLGHTPIEKGLSPATVHWAEAWFVVTGLFGLLHLDIGYVYEFVENRALHGLKEAIVETGSWLLALNGLWLFVLTRPPTSVQGGETVFMGPKPALLYRVFDAGPDAAFELGFAGIPGLFTVSVPLVGPVPFVELVGVVMILAGAVLLASGPTHELIEFHQILAHVLSYLRIGAVLLAKAGMAFAVNLLFFGAIVDGDGGYHFLLTHSAESQYVVDHYPEAEVLFPGIVHFGLAAAVLGVLVLLIGHLVVLLLGVTSAGIQSIRLEYFEFFSKFYEGNGTPYAPFGRDRKYTPEE